jgi:hypothetical protein
MCTLKYILNCEQHFSYFDPDYPASGLTVAVLESFFFNLHSRGWSQVGPLVSSATSDLLYLPRVIVRMEEFGGMKFGRGPQRHFVHHLTRPWRELGPPRSEAID